MARTKLFAIRSERALCRDVQVNSRLSLVLRASIEDKIPDHSAFSCARNERFHLRYSLTS